MSRPKEDLSDLKARLGLGSKVRKVQEEPYPFDIRPKVAPSPKEPEMPEDTIKALEKRLGAVGADLADSFMGIYFDLIKEIARRRIKSLEEPSLKTERNLEVAVALAKKVRSFPDLLDGAFKEMDELYGDYSKRAAK